MAIAASVCISAGCSGRVIGDRIETERAVYTTLLEHVRGVAVAGTTPAVYPYLINVDSVDGPAPGYLVEHFWPERSSVLAEVVAALPGFILCSGDRIGHCDTAEDNVHITLSSIELMNTDRASAWVLVNDLTPDRGSTYYYLAYVEREPDRWTVTSFRLISVDDYH